MATKLYCYLSEEKEKILKNIADKKRLSCSGLIKEIIDEWIINSNKREKEIDLTYKNSVITRILVQELCKVKLEIPSHFKDVTEVDFKEKIENMERFAEEELSKVN